MIGAMEVDESDEVPWAVHIEPLIHVEVDADDPLEAQMKAQKEVVEELGDTDLTVVELNLESLNVDEHGLLADMMGMGDDVLGIDDMVPDDDSDLGSGFGLDDETDDE